MNEPTLDQVLAQMGDVGQRMARIDAAEGAAGNISVFLAGAIAAPDAFVAQGKLSLPVRASHLAGGTVVVTGASRRLGDIATMPEATLCLLQVVGDGTEALIYGAAHVRPTSELNTHLAVHNDHVGRRQLRHHAVVHAQPVRLTYLSHILAYQETFAFNRRLLRWQPETIIEFPEGIGMLPFQMPGSPDQMRVTTDALVTHRGVVWARHGIVTRSDAGAGKAGDLIEYAEAAAHYEYLNLQVGERSSGLADAEMRLICERLGIDQKYF